ncbi:MAG: ParB N-terminal domain-containing protein [Fibrobacteres bacterium]|nr:ParB N-terminal domain-containing protein [Fibrobacterota bacterium]
MIIEEEIKELGFDTPSAIQHAKDGRLEEWVHRYCVTGEWKNIGLSDGLKLHKRWWNGPLEIELSKLTRVVGPEPNMEYNINVDLWNKRITEMSQSFTNELALPPLIVEYRSGKLRLADGNTRYGAMTLLGWQKCWVIIWYNSERDYLHHSSRL